MEKIETKLQRIQSTIYRLRDISDKLRDGDISPGMRQSLRKQYLEGEANLRHQIRALNEFISGRFIKITFKKDYSIYVSSFINCTKEEAENIVRSYPGGQNIEILEIKEEIAHPQPVKL